MVRPEMGPTPSSSAKRALITGITGQDGSYLAELLLSKGYEVFGLVHPYSPLPGGDVSVIHGSLNKPTYIRMAFDRSKPHEVYHLGAISSLAECDRNPDSAIEVNLTSTQQILDLALEFGSKVFFASSCHIYGHPRCVPQTLMDPERPTTLYGVTKLAATNLVRIARDRGLFAVNGICYSHESPRRGDSFVTSKIARAAAMASLGHIDKGQFGNLDSIRDWGDARDFVRGFWQSLQASDPRDYIFATGVPRTVQSVAEEAFRYAGLDWHDYVTVTDSLMRLNDGAIFCGDPKETEKLLGWKREWSFSDTIKSMVDHHRSLLTRP